MAYFLQISENLSPGLCSMGVPKGVVGPADYYVEIGHFFVHLIDYASLPDLCDSCQLDAFEGGRSVPRHDQLHDLSRHKEMGFTGLFLFAGIFLTSRCCGFWVQFLSVTSAKTLRSTTRIVT